MLARMIGMLMRLLSPFVCRSIWLSFIIYPTVVYHTHTYISVHHLSIICLPSMSSVCLSYLSIYLPVCHLSITYLLYLSIYYLPIYLKSTCLTIIYMSIYLSFQPSICLFTYLSILFSLLPSSHSTRQPINKTPAIVRLAADSDKGCDLRPKQAPPSHSAELVGRQIRE